MTIQELRNQVQAQLNASQSRNKVQSASDMFKECSRKAQKEEAKAKINQVWTDWDSYIG